MENVINLNNDYYIKVISKNDEVPLEVINITNFKIIDALREKEIIFKIDFNEFRTKKYKPILKKYFLLKI